MRNNTRYPIKFKVKKIVNAGYTGRNQEEARKHIEELKKAGVTAPESTPTLYSVPKSVITIDKEIQVMGSQTSGEAEFVLLLEDERRIYVGVGSDHTDRELEKNNILISKVVCPNIISREIWFYSEVKDHWDDLILRSWVKDQGEKRLYQEGSLQKIMRVEDLINLVKEKILGDLEGLIFYSGTIPLLTEKMIYGDYFESELFSPLKGNRLRCEYRVQNIKG